MQIACPSCTTTYLLADNAVGSTGRSVRCSRCQNVWFVPPLQAVAEPAFIATDAAVAAFRMELGGGPDALPPGPLADAADAPSLADPLVDPALMAQADVDARASDPIQDVPDAPGQELPREPDRDAPADGGAPAADSPPLAPLATDRDQGDLGGSPVNDGPRDVESVAARRAREPRRRWWQPPLPVLIVLLAAATGAVLGFRHQVVRHVPQLASFYSALGLPVNLRGLAFADVRSGREVHDGVPVLVVEGTLVNTVSKPVTVPRLRFALLNAAGAEVYAWTAQANQQMLKPGEALPFRSRLAAPPADGRDVQVRFFTRRDLVAGLP